MKTVAESTRVPFPRLPWHKRQARLWMGLSLLLADLLAFALIGGLVMGLTRPAWASAYRLNLELIQLQALFCLLLFTFSGLYPGIGISPVTEIRKLSITTSAVALSLAAFSFLAPNLVELPRIPLFIAWLAGLFALPVSRIAIRYLLSRLPAWGEPVALFGGGKRARMVFDHLNKRRMLGLDPVLVGAQGETLPTGIDRPCLVLETLLDDPQGMRRMGIHTAIITAGAIDEPLRTRLLHLQGEVFERLIKIPDQHDLGSLGVSALDLDGVFAFEVHQNLANRSRRWLKRAIDLGLTLGGGLLVLPLLLLLALLVRRSSPGPVIYKQTRIGQGGRRFKAWKFRTMVANAEELLDQTLSKSPEMRAEWEATQKLRQDPRITPIGRFLRKFSLDELPQLWNVLRGEMSLVGPRPCMEEQAGLYGDDFELYTAVQPGITGLWQVSGRNGTTYAERVRLDAYYVRNWSIWMDFYILLKTFWVVIKHDGAY